MYLGLGLRLASGTVAGFDADAAAYFDRAGVTDATAKSQINAFVKGIKDLGIYNSTVCWLLRSSQNKGSGTTVYSLGGFGTFDGTFGGSPNPTWTADGVQSSGANLEAKINIPSTITSLTSAGCTIYGVVSKGVCDNYGLFLTEIGGISAYPSILLNFVNSTGVIPFATRNSTRYFQSVRGGAFAAGFSSVAGVFGSTSQANFRNSTLISNDTGLGTLNLTGPVDIYAIAQAGNVSNDPGVICSIVFATSTMLSDANLSNLNTLYKNTLGTGLGLP
jgi:hypothetical protein